MTHLHKNTPINRSLAVLKAPDIPSLLIETGYLSNEDESKLLATGKYQRAIAHAIYVGIKNYIIRNKDVLRCGVTGATNAVSTQKVTTTSSSSSTSGPKTEIYIVKKGDFLSKIADRYGVSVTYLKKLNNLKREQVNVGQRLKVPKR